jgi:hypothetical protein
MKIFACFFILFTFQEIYAQSTLHPGKAGAGYYYLHSLTDEFSAESHNFYLSTKRFDIFLAASAVKIENESFNDFGLGISIPFIKEGRRLMPAMNFTIGSAAERALFFGLGPGLAYLILDYDFIRIYPEAAAQLTIFGLVPSVDFSGQISFTTDMVIALRLGTGGFLVIQPGYSTGGSVHYYSLAGGISILF